MKKGRVFNVAICGHTVKGLIFSRSPKRKFFKSVIRLIFFERFTEIFSLFFGNVLEN